MSLDVYLILDKCTHCGRGDDAWSANITHNLTNMAAEAGIYGIVWRPEENGIKTARQLIEPLRKALADMRADTARFRRHDAKNGWGTYDQFVPWLERYLVACERMPDASVASDR